MLDYYHILGISRQAEIAEIKKAYKALAFQYHPDKNPDDPAAEEMIKQINEAYEVLSDPYKKASHDLLLNYSEQKQQTQRAYTPPPNYRRRTVRKEERSVYDRYGKYSWSERPRYQEAPAYKVDKTYVRNQLIAFGTIIILGIIIIGVYKFNDYLEDQRELQIVEENNRVLAQAQDLYNNQEYRPAIGLIKNLIEKYPIRHRLYEEKEKMVSRLTNSALSLYNSQSYGDAVSKLEVIRDYERPMRIKTWKMIADCYNQIGEYRKALHAYDYILIREDSNVELMIAMADIYHDRLDMPEKALEYYSEARHTFRQFQVANYGEAFELIMRPENIPVIYYNMFTKRAALNSDLDNYDQAIKDYNWAIFLKPNIANNYYLRAMCRFNMGNLSRACSDWSKAINLGHATSRQMRSTHCN